MKQLTKQIVPFEQAVESHKLGLIQQSLFYYVLNWRNPIGQEIEDGEHIIPADMMHQTRLQGRKRGAEVEFISAYTLTEAAAFTNFNFTDFKLILAALRAYPKGVHDYNRAYINHFEIDTDGHINSF